MNTTPEEEANPVLLAFKQLNTQLANLVERERRAEERERNAFEREQKLLERQSKFYESMKNMMLKLDNFQRSIADIEIRTKTYLEGYFRVLPKQVVVVEEQRWSIESKTQRMLCVLLFGMLLSGLLVYFASPHVDVARLEYQSQRIRELEAKLDYMEAKNPKTARSYDAEKLR